MVGEGAALALPWLEVSLRQALSTQRAHALLVHGPQGVGQLELGLALAKAWLCEAAPAESRPCGRCASCRLVDVRSHPDMLVLLPAAVREALGWEGGDAEGDGEGKASKAKPSKEIKVEAVRGAVSFAQSTSARGRGKVVVIYPAERMNAISANTLLKTLEEPPGATRFVLACGEPHTLLPTIRSRCQAVLLPLPDRTVALKWLAEQGVPGPEVLLDATGGQPLEALAWSRDGVESKAWAALPSRIANGDLAALTGWPLPRAVDALQKLCHDALLAAAGAPPRYFPAAAIPKGAGLDSLGTWSKELLEAARHAEHPWNAGLMLEALVQQARKALAA